ncbi:MAG: rhomboid family protein [Paracoccaceae bacterium]
MPATGTARPSVYPAANRWPVALVIIIGVSALAEAILEGADLGLWGNPGWRRTAIEYGAFWAGLLGNWRPNFPGQPVTMFLTHAFLHAGAWHFIANVITLLILERQIRVRFGQGALLLLFVASVFGGALAFALILPTADPMVGASGGIFGLFGALAADECEARRGVGKAVYGLAVLALVIVLNLMQWWVSEGVLAWQAHLGGFAFGWLLGPPLRKREV